MELFITIERLIFKDKNFFILKTNQGIAKGHIYDLELEDVSPEYIVGLKYRLEGEWKNDKYGRFFSFTYAEMLTEYRLFLFLSKIAKIGEKVTLNLIEYFGNDLEYIIENQPERLVEVKGIGEKRAKKIVSNWYKYGCLRQLAKFLAPFNISHNYIVKIYNRFGEKSLEIIKSNPYCLTEINGIGFKTTDKLALSLGIDPNDPKRIIACTEYVLQIEGNNNGHCYLSLDILKEKIIDTLDIHDFDTNILLTNSNFIVCNYSSDTLIGFKNLYDKEKYIYRYLTLNNETNYLFSPDKVKEFLDEYQTENNITFSDDQIKAIYEANKSKIFALTGYAGTGKSSVTKAILQLLAIKLGRSNIVGCSLSLHHPQDTFF
ncbi:helix-hairpin-helix domain-containing protein [Deferribacter desulfuricans]|uniref:helix-hairpin-helix domain-containing protein n=1 Tax=Deferribacter desulfuricans TaxID=197162 RepID=UPI0002E21481|nr:helix-hairpin-helix domain-containing protein [Deferribacter desulfuricans]